MSYSGEDGPQAAIGRCIDCDYSLRGLTTARCPECGREFDFTDPKTMNFGPRMGRLRHLLMPFDPIIGRLRRYLMRPVGWPLVVAAASAAGPEADGMIAYWEPQFFRTDGTRLLLLLSPAEYDALCPIRIRPPPTELVRVGIVLLEL